jgi:hypothetical protein
MPSKYWPLIRNLPKYISARNEAAHSSAGEFAELLTSLKPTHPTIYEKWAAAFPIAYGGTVEEREIEALKGYRGQIKKFKEWLEEARAPRSSRKPGKGHFNATCIMDSVLL